MNWWCSITSPIALLLLDRVMEPPDASKRLQVIEGDVRCAEDLDRAFCAASASIAGVVHFAGRKAVQAQWSSLSLVGCEPGRDQEPCRAMGRHGCGLVVFGGTATVYGEPEVFPLLEEMPTPPVHPYAQTKLAAEQMLAALVRSQDWRVASLRYFDPVRLCSGRIGED